MKSVWKWILISLGVLIVIIIGVSWYFANNWKPLVEQKLKDVIHNSTNGLYTLTYDDLDLNLALGNVTLKNAHLIPDSAVYAKLVLAKEAPNNQFNIKLDALKIRRFGLMNILTNKKLSINTIILENADIHLVNEYHAYNDTISTKPKKTLYESVQDVLSSISVKDIKIDNFKFKFTKLADGKSSDILLDSVNINIHDVLLDETSINDSSRLFYTKMVDIHVPKFAYEMPDDIYKASFEDLRLNTQKKNLLLTRVSYAPKMSKANFFKTKNQNVTMAVMNFDTVRIDNIDLKQLLDNQITVAKSVQLKSGAVSLYNDKRFRKVPKNKIGNSPHQQLMKMKSLLSIDTVYVDDVDILYGEFSAKYNQEGIITFNHATGILTNVTNDSLRLSKDKFMRADLTAKIMKSGTLKAQFGFDMLSKTGFYTYKGSLGPMQATAYNKILRPLLNVEIASGNVKSVRFDMQGTDTKNWGDFRFDYDNLKIKLLNEPDAEKKSSKKVISFIVNNIIINDSNPDANEVYHTGKINYTRNPQHTFFKTLWQSLLEGIKQCAGISPEREARLMGAAKDVKNASKETQGALKKTGSFIKGIFKKNDKEEK
ncbi:hypothetical protein [Sphingobacterium hungaricum]|uniref:Uncharacterized protein n=1 Tax=Sphingobacterium hungaricum TaxID=2082723 RepID=A0A928YQG2_9SPHI|nr:hypothetical protein [Sphingobacterium hungaricum]MBE8714191.1 hypothetical protein [Sphingobacterium hungaricum]